MREIRALLSEKSVLALQRLIGRDLGMVWAPKVLVSGEFCLADFFVINAKCDVFVTVASEWLETEEDELDYWQLKAESVTAATIEGSSFSSVALPSSSPLASIDVLSDEYCNDRLRIHNDIGLIFKHVDGAAFYLGAESSISGMVEYTSGLIELRKIAAALKPRFSLSGGPFRACR